MKFHLEHPLARFEETIDNNCCESDEALSSSLFYLESGHMVSQSYAQSLKDPVKLWMRRDGIAAISKICWGRFDPSVSYLAVNYLDRFFSAQGIPCAAEKWVGKLIAVTCVTLAAKMMNVAGFNVGDIQCGEEGFIFDAQTIERLEMIILGALNWRMRSITPFSFLNFFISLFKFNDPPRIRILKSRAVEIIFKTQTETKLLELNPSLVAASAMLSACEELFPMQFPCFREAVYACPYVDKEKLASCYEGMVTLLASTEELEYEPMIVFGSGGSGGPTRSDTPVNVLDRQWSWGSSCCYSAQGDNTNRNATHIYRNHDSRTDNDGINGNTSGAREVEREAKRQRSIGLTNSCILYSPASASSSSSNY